MLDDIVHAAQTDRYARFTAFYGKFYNPDVNLGERISQEVVTAHRSTATRSAPVVAHVVAPAPRENGEPVMIPHETADRVLPVDATGGRFEGVVPAAEIRRDRRRTARTAVARDEFGHALLGFIKHWTAEERCP
ncbi:hypothetical protein ACFW5D_32000 [Streptomyces sp. NPDC058770]|uniref:hypothetical protein n=1 Tax=Streptomyces sp. NPDC058770 TaxID=3346631 RepID=UPI0036CD034F